MLFRPGQRGDRVGQTVRERIYGEVRKDRAAREEAEVRAAEQALRPARVIEGEPARVDQADERVRENSSTPTKGQPDPVTYDRDQTLHGDDEELDEEVAPIEGPWAALAATEEPCPTQEGLLLVRQAAARWQSDGLRFSGKARATTPAQRGEILRRDAYCCATPGCPNHMWLEVHHIVFYCAGGVTVPDNLLTLCSRCHRKLHEGRLGVTGVVPQGLLWVDATGQPLGVALEPGKPLGLVKDGCSESSLE